MRRVCLALAVGLLFVLPVGGVGAEEPGGGLWQEIDRRAGEVVPRVVKWRRHFHQHPELSNREFETAAFVAARLRELGLGVQTEVAHTGVVGLLRGGQPGPVVALRADMDALPVTEQGDLSFKSTARTQYNGREVGVMHACGHDNHMAVLLGVAEVLSGMRERLPGSVKFIFQPAEEGPPAGEEGGAGLMVKQGVLQNPTVDAIFGLHVFPYEVGSLHYRPGGIMAAADGLKITVRGRQTHGAIPWAGVDPIVVSSQIVMALQTLTSRQADITRAPAIVTIGSMHGGNRGNIIPDEVTLEGTIRTFDRAMQEDLHRRIRRTVEHIAESAGATAEVHIQRQVPVTFNDPRLVARMAPTFKRVAGDRVDTNVQVTTTAEDFALFQEKVPGLYFFLGITPADADPARVAANHSPHFFADEGALMVGVRALAHLAVDYMLETSAAR